MAAAAGWRPLVEALANDDAQVASMITIYYLLGVIDEGLDVG